MNYPALLNPGVLHRQPELEPLPHPKFGVPDLPNLGRLREIAKTAQERIESANDEISANRAMMHHIILALREGHTPAKCIENSQEGSSPVEASRAVTLYAHHALKKEHSSAVVRQDYQPLQRNRAPAEHREFLQVWLSSIEEITDDLERDITKLRNLSSADERTASLKKPLERPNLSNPAERVSYIFSLLAHKNWCCFYANKITLATTRLYVARRMTEAFMHPDLFLHSNAIKGMALLSIQRINALPSASLKHPAIIAKKCHNIIQEMDQRGQQILGEKLPKKAISRKPDPHALVTYRGDQSLRSSECLQ